MNVALDLELWTETEADPEGITVIPKRIIAVIDARLALASLRRGVEDVIVVHEPSGPEPQEEDVGGGFRVGSMSLRASFQSQNLCLCCGAPLLSEVALLRISCDTRCTSRFGRV